MHLASLFHFATDSTTGAVVVLGLPCALILLAVWLTEHRLKQRQMRRELEAERQAAKRERVVLDTINRFRR